MDGFSLNITISALATAIARDKTPEEITLLSVFFTQLGDSLATIITGNELCCNNGNENSEIEYT